MSELKAIYAYTSDEIDTLYGHAEGNEYYLKSEADKVIAELESKLDIYKRGFKEDDKTIAYLYAELCHNKYKRCLAMAKWCDSEMNYWYDRIEMEQCQRFKFYDKWYQRWLEIAENFKEVYDHNR